MKRFDAIIIGAGQAGPPLAIRLAAAGQDRGDHRAKALRWHVRQHRLHADQDAHRERTGRSRRPASRLLRRHRSGTHRLRPAARQGAGRRRLDRRTREVESSLRGADRCTVIEGHARFASRDTVDVDGETLGAERIFINVGGRARIPEMPGMGDVSYLTNSSILALETLPRHLLIIGGGPVGLEFAQMYRRFGSDVTVIEMGPRLFGREDEDVSTAVEGILEREGVKVRVGAECVSLCARSRGCDRSPGVRDRRPSCDRFARLARIRAAAEHRRPRSRPGRRRRRCAGIRARRRLPAHERARNLGARRVQWARRIHAHRVQRPRDRRRELARARAIER